MPKHSAGILLYRKSGADYEVLIVHPGGPFWAKKDHGAWSIPKGEFVEGEDPLVAAKREFEEEVGSPPPEGDYLQLGDATQSDEKWPGFKQPGGKIVHPFALEADFDLEHFRSNMFQMEWPPKSGSTQEFPECDKAAWVSLAAARQKLVKGQVVFIDQLAEILHIPLTDLSDDQSAQASLF